MTFRVFALVSALALFVANAQVASASSPFSKAQAWRAQADSLKVSMLLDGDLESRTRFVDELLDWRLTNEIARVASEIAKSAAGRLEVDSKVEVFTLEGEVVAIRFFLSGGGSENSTMRSQSDRFFGIIIDRQGRPSSDASQGESSTLFEFDGTRLKPLKADSFR